MIFGIKEKCIMLTHKMYINIPVLLMTASVLQGHISFKVIWSLTQIFSDTNMDFSKA